MATLLHIDTSLNGENSVSRAVAASFREGWEAQHPGSTVIYRDLAASPLPHLDAVAYQAGFVAPADHTPEQRAAFALRAELIAELEQADAILLASPLYNYGVPSNLKAWLDHVMMVGRTTGTEQPTAAGTPVTVVTSRGGSYGPGTPQEGNDFAIPYLTHTLGTMGITAEFIVPELTLARSVPAMSQLIDLADASRAKAHEAATAQGRALAAQLTATADA
jgi:FMN-dependent NADH-azoreductase